MIEQPKSAGNKGHSVSHSPVLCLGESLGDAVAGSLKPVNHWLVLLQWYLHFSHLLEEINTYIQQQ